MTSNDLLQPTHGQAEENEKRRAQIKATYEKAQEKLAAINADAAEKRHKVSWKGERWGQPDGLFVLSLLEACLMPVSLDDPF